MIQRSFVIDPKYVLTLLLTKTFVKKKTIFGQKGLRSGIIWSRTKHHVEQNRVEKQNEKQKAEKQVANIICLYHDVYIRTHYGSYGIVDSVSSYQTDVYSSSPILC
jgi:hypothetical protein